VPPGFERYRCYLFSMDIEQAVKNAKAFASRSLGPERTANIRLEEIESSVVDGMPVWLITMSSGMDVQSPATRQVLGFLGAEVDREYKVFAVSKDSGEVLSMKIRLLAAPGL
jgi:hypothetical protein